METKRFAKTLLYFGPLILWMGVIFYFSAQEGSGHQYHDLRMFIERKGAHVFEYLILTLLGMRMLKYFNKPLGKSIAYAALISLIYAASDEFHQLFVYGREGKLSDVGIDFIGIIMALLIYFGWTSCQTKKEEK